MIDVREKNEFDTGRIRGACLLPLGELEARQGLLNKDSNIVIVCRSGNRSSTAAALLAKWGFTSVYNLAGGMISWAGSTEEGEGGCRY